MSPEQPQHRPLTWQDSLPADKRHLAWTPHTTVTLTLGLPDGTRTVWQRKVSLATGDLAWNVAAYRDGPGHG